MYSDGESITFEFEENGGDVLGSVQYPNNGSEAYAALQCIYVYNNRRGEGAGKHLIQKFEDICIILGAKMIYGTFLPHSDCDSSKVERFYYRNGYDISEVQPDGYRYLSKNLCVKRLTAGDPTDNSHQEQILNQNGLPSSLIEI